MANKKLSRREKIALSGIPATAEQHGINRGIAFAKMRIVSALLEEAGSSFMAGLDDRAKLVRELAAWVSGLEVKMATTKEKF